MPQVVQQGIIYCGCANTNFFQLGCFCGRILSCASKGETKSVNGWKAVNAMTSVSWPSFFVVRMTIARKWFFENQCRRKLNLLSLFFLFPVPNFWTTCTNTISPLAVRLSGFWEVCPLKRPRMPVLPRPKAWWFRRPPATDHVLLWPRWRLHVSACARAAHPIT